MIGKRISALVLIAGIVIIAFFVQSHTREKLDEMMHDLRNVSLVFVGEFHDNKNHHDAQLRIIRELNERDVPVSVGLEMFRANSQEKLDRWVEGEMSVSITHATRGYPS
jgi:uncharacterized iron-regulated protein